MTIRVSGFSNRNYPVAVADGAGDIVAAQYFYDLPTAQNVTGDIIDIGPLPAGHTVVRAVLVPDDLDSATGITLDVGIMSGAVGDTSNSRTCGAEIFAASTAAQTGTPVTPTIKSAYTIQAVDYDRSIGVKIASQSTTPVAGRVRLLLDLAAVDRNVPF